MDYECLFKGLESFSKKEDDENKDTCCSNINNHINKDSIIICSLCESVISNIVDSPEWRYYGTNDS